MHFACEHADKDGGLELIQWLCRAGGDVYVRNITEQLRAIDKAPMHLRKPITGMLLDAKEGTPAWAGYGDADWRQKWRHALLKEWRSGSGLGDGPREVEPAVVDAEDEEDADEDEDA